MLDRRSGGGGWWGRRFEGVGAVSVPGVWLGWGGREGGGGMVGRGDGGTGP